MRNWILVAILALVACVPANSEPSDSAAPVGDAVETGMMPGMTRVTGTVRVVGSAPMNTQVVVRDEQGSSIRVEGALASEIARLSGAEVEVMGSVENGVIEATDYRVRSVDGRPVVMGIVERTTDGDLQLRTPSGDVVALEGATGRFEVGQKVWVQGPSMVRVQTYGVIRP